MPKFSVKRPMTVFVVVMIIIALGIVSLPGMTPDLMPSIDLPSISAANYSLVILEFEQDASMDSAVVDILQNEDKSKYAAGHDRGC